MKKELIAQLVSKGKAKKQTKGFILKRGTGMYVIDLTPELGRTFTVEAKNEVNAREQVVQLLEKEAVQPRRT